MVSVARSRAEKFRFFVFLMVPVSAMYIVNQREFMHQLLLRQKYITYPPEKGELFTGNKAEIDEYLRTKLGINRGTPAEQVGATKAIEVDASPVAIQSEPRSKWFRIF